MKKKICIVTGSRADYGLLKHLIHEIALDTELGLLLAVTGSHLSKKFGYTYKEIEDDGHKIDFKINLDICGDEPTDVARSTALSISGFSAAFSKLRPDLIVILGDRYEILGAAISAMYHEIPVAHIHGGEVTEGAFDENIRHALTKFSHIHFVANEEYRRRVIQLGEDPSNVHNVGGLGADAINRISLMPKRELESDLNLKFKAKNLLVTFHPITHEKSTTILQMKELLKALSIRDDSLIIFTMPNADPNNNKLMNLITEFVESRENCHFFHSLGQLRYLSCLAIVDAVIGNSSSGLLEAPALKKTSINVGNRQEGRLKAVSVIDCEPTFNSINNAIDYSYKKEFTDGLKLAVSPYGNGGAVNKVVEIIKDYSLIGLLKKKFYDIS